MTAAPSASLDSAPTNAEALSPEEAIKSSDAEMHETVAVADEATPLAGKTEGTQAFLRSAPVLKKLVVTCRSYLHYQVHILSNAILYDQHHTRTPGKSGERPRDETILTLPIHFLHRF